MHRVYHSQCVQKQQQKQLLQELPVSEIVQWCPGARKIMTANSMSLARVIALLWSGWCQFINHNGTCVIDLV